MTLEVRPISIAKANGYVEQLPPAFKPKEDK